MLTERSQEKGKQAICFYLYKVQRQAKGISAIRGSSYWLPEGGEAMSGRSIWGRGLLGLRVKVYLLTCAMRLVGSSSQTRD